MEEVVDGEDYPEPNFPPEAEKVEGEEGAENAEGDAEWLNNEINLFKIEIIIYFSRFYHSLY